MYTVFVCHAKEQIDLAEDLKGRLSAPNVEVFLADSDAPPGGSLSNQISKGIKQSHLFILLWTTAASESNYVEKEIFLANSENVDIIPIILESELNLPRELGDMKYLDGSNDLGKQIDWLQDKIETEANNEDVSNMIGLGILAFVAWAILK